MCVNALLVQSPLTGPPWVMYCVLPRVMTPGRTKSSRNFSRASSGSVLRRPDASRHGIWVWCLNSVFLLSLATAGRCHSLAALENKVVVVSHNPFVLQIGYHLSYIPKQYYRLKDRKPITPVLLEAMPPGECDSLCPVTTLIAYRKRVASLRKPGQSSLFIPHDTSKPTRLHPAAVGRYVVKVILLAYERAGIRPPRGVRVHDVRGVAIPCGPLLGRDWRRCWLRVSGRSHTPLLNSTSKISSGDICNSLEKLLLSSQQAT